MGLFNKFTDTIFLKESSSLEEKYNALSKLSQEYPDREDIKEELYIVKKGLDGEREIHYQLEKANIGMYVLHDINIEYEGLTAQIDYVVFTRLCCYFIECKNLVGNITVDENGAFIREYTFNGRKVRKGMYSPLRQVEAQRDVYKKIWNNKLSHNPIINSIKRILAESNFELYHRVLVVAANNETILNTRYASNNVKSKIVRADALVSKIKEDLKNSDKKNWSSARETESWAKAFSTFNVEKKIDYYEYYKSKYCINSSNDNVNLKEDLIAFRKDKSNSMSIPAYYVFTNDELEKILEVHPRTIEELNGILPSIKIQTHGKEIIDIINKDI